MILGRNLLQLPQDHSSTWEPHRMIQQLLIWQIAQLESVRPLHPFGARKEKDRSEAFWTYLSQVCASMDASRAEEEERERLARIALGEEAEDAPTEATSTSEATTPAKANPTAQGSADESDAKVPTPIAPDSTTSTDESHSDPADEGGKPDSTKTSAESALPMAVDKQPGKEDQEVGSATERPAAPQQTPVLYTYPPNKRKKKKKDRYPPPNRPG